MKMAGRHPLETALGKIPAYALVAPIAILRAKENISQSVVKLRELQYEGSGLLYNAFQSKIFLKLPSNDVH